MSSELLKTWAASGTKTEPSAARQSVGWVPGTLPPASSFNWLESTKIEKINYLLGAGIPEWDAATAYGENAFTRVGGTLYKALQATTGDDPETPASVYWEEFSASSTDYGYDVLIAPAALVLADASKNIYNDIDTALASDTDAGTRFLVLYSDAWTVTSEVTLSAGQSMRVVDGSTITFTNGRIILGANTTVRGSFVCTGIGYGTGHSYFYSNGDNVRLRDKIKIIPTGAALAESSTVFHVTFNGDNCEYDFEFYDITYTGTGTVYLVLNGNGCIHSDVKVKAVNISAASASQLRGLSFGTSSMYHFIKVDFVNFTCPSGAYGILFETGSLRNVMTGMIYGVANSLFGDSGNNKTGLIY